MAELGEITSEIFPEFSDENTQVWKEEPVSPKEFFDNFLKEPCYPLQQKFVDKVLGTGGPEWDTKFTEGIALVGKGGGKDRTIAKILTYVVYKLLCLHNPQQYLGLGGTGSAIDLGNVSINSRLAKDVFFKNFKTLMKNTIDPKTKKNWFVGHGINLAKAIQTREVKLPNNITVYSLDSEEYTGEGLNLFVVIFDEVAGFPVAKAKTLYDALKKTQRSRFPQHHKTLLLSWPRDLNDYMMIRYREAKKEEKTYRVKHSTWDWNILRKKSDFETDYLRDPVEARRVYQCEVTIGEKTYIRNRAQLLANFTNDRENPCLNNEIWTSELLLLKFKPWFVPLKAINYYCHVDLAKGETGGDCAGIAIGHYDPQLQTLLTKELLADLLKSDGLDMSKYNNRKHGGVIIDLALQLRARQGQELQFEDIRLFIEKLKTHYKFRIHKVTYDGWQSVGELQLLKKTGFIAETLSVDKDRVAYDSLKDLVYKGTIPMYTHPIALRELEELQLIKKGTKVDHPEFSGLRIDTDGVNRNDGSKDVADAMAGVVKLCEEEAPYAFSAWLANMRPQDNEREPQQVQQQEQEQLVRYGERPAKRANW